MIVIQAPGIPAAMFEAGFTIGRSSADERRHCDVTVDDDYASAPHARFYFRDGIWFVEDLGSQRDVAELAEHLGAGHPRLRPGPARQRRQAQDRPHGPHGRA